MFAARLDADRGTDVGLQYTSFTPTDASRFGLAFAAACARPTSATSRALQDATVAFVERLKQEGLPPERVIVTLKEALTRHAGSHRVPSLDDGDRGRDEHEGAGYRDVFAWCLDAYYGAD